MPTIPPAFHQKKAKILAELARPAEEYADLSPKGSVDVEIRELIDEINAVEGLVTTSSCAGRVSVFLEGRKAVTQPDETKKRRGSTSVASAGGKGGGGTWLFVSHNTLEPMRPWKDAFGLGDGQKGNEAVEWRFDSDVAGKRLIHFKFEPMILHILTASIDYAQRVLQAAIAAGFRESGALSLAGTEQQLALPAVAVRTIGLAFQSLIGVETDGQRQMLVSEEYLRHLVDIGNERFQENMKRIARFRTELRKAIAKGPGTALHQGLGREGPVTRRERLRAEGLQRQKQLAKKDRPEEEAESPVDNLPLSIPNT